MKGRLKYLAIYMYYYTDEWYEVTKLATDFPQESPNGTDKHSCLKRVPGI